MARKIGAIIIFILGAVLLVYSATRSLDFISLTLPDDRKVLAYFGIAALDGGLIAWVMSYLYGSKGWQRAIAFLMVVVDLLGAVAMFTLDTLYNTGRMGMTTALTASQLQTAVLALSGVIALNIAAAIAHHLTDPEKLREQAEEEAFSKVEDATLKQISQNADQLAAQLAPTLAQEWMTQTRARYLSNVGTGKVTTLLDITAQDMPPTIPPKQDSKPSLDIGVLFPSLFSRKNGNGGQPLNQVKVKGGEEAEAKPVPFGIPDPKK